jgi:hypothetical protein
MRRFTWRPFVASALVAAFPFAACSSNDSAPAAADDGGSNDGPPRRRDTGRDTRSSSAQDDDATNDDGDDSPLEATLDADAGDAGACAPSNAAYVASWHPPAARASACTAGELDLFWTSCWTGGIHSAACTTFLGAHGACAACLLTPSSAVPRGAVAVFATPDLVSINSPGCVALVDGDTSANGCGAAGQALHDCKVAACAACDTSAANFPTFQACESAAATKGCASFAADFDAKCAELKDAGAPLSTCTGRTGQSQHDYFTGIAAFFCSGAADAASDAPHGG